MASKARMVREKKIQAKGPATPQPVLAPVWPVVGGKNRDDHGYVDYVWLGAIITLVAVYATFWPVWDQLIGAEEEDCFSILGIERGADKGLIRSAYKDLARKWHPDWNPGCGDECRERMRAVQDAYEMATSNPNASPEKDDGSDFNSHILNLFLIRLFDMAFHAGEFATAILPGVAFTQWVGVRGFVVLGSALSMYLYLTDVGVPLSWLGMGICIWKFTKQGDWTPATRATEPQLWYVLFVLLPAIAVRVAWVARYQRGMSWYSFSLSLAAGTIYLTACLIRTPPQLLRTSQFVRRVPIMPKRAILGYIWDVACQDLLCYVIKVPAPFRLATHCMFLLYLYQRWIYKHVPSEKLFELLNVIAPGAVVEHMDSNATVGSSGGSSSAAGSGAAAASPAAPKAVATEGAKLTKQERKQKQRAAGIEPPNYRLYCMLLGVVVFMVAVGVAPYIHQRMYPNAVASPGVNASSGPSPSSDHHTGDTRRGTPENKDQPKKTKTGKDKASTNGKKDGGNKGGKKEEKVKKEKKPNSTPNEKKTNNNKEKKKKTNKKKST